MCAGSESLPGFLLDASEDPTTVPIAMSEGQRQYIQSRDLVVSDEQGGIRTKTSTEQGPVVGYITFLISVALFLVPAYSSQFIR